MAFNPLASPGSALPLGPAEPSAELLHPPSQGCEAERGRSDRFSNYLSSQPPFRTPLRVSACRRPSPPRTCVSKSSAQEQICLLSRPIEAIAEINV